jgi:hypothetical protein
VYGVCLVPRSQESTACSFRNSDEYSQCLLIVQFSNWHQVPCPAFLTYLLTPRSRVVLEKLIGFQLVKKFPVFYGTQKFIIAFTLARHLSLSLCEHFITRYCLRWGVVSISPYPKSWRTTLCRLSATNYSIYSQLPSTLQTVPPSANWGHAMPWWQGPNYHVLLSTFIISWEIKCLSVIPC